jgi:hypothetical protein
LLFFDWPDSDMAMAIARFRLFTFLPDALFNFPFLCSCMTLGDFALLPGRGHGYAPKFNANHA